MKYNNTYMRQPNSMFDMFPYSDPVIQKKMFETTIVD